MKNTGETIKTTCPYCGVGCGVLATQQTDGSVVIKGDKEHPANYGRLCSKGAALGETLDHEGRLLHPKINGKQASWDVALTTIADTFSKTIKEHGPDSVAFYVSGQILTEDYYVANKLMKGFIGSGNIDTNSRLCMASSVVGHRKAFGTDTVPGNYEDLESTDLLVLVGSNLAWCHPVIYQRIVAAKQARPHMKVVLIDPRRTMTADLADLHLPIKPDGDIALFLGLLKHLNDSKALNHSYINDYTSGFENALSEATKLTMEEILDATGLSAQDLLGFYALFERTEKAVTLYSQGVNQSACGSDKVSAIINCHLATGRIGKQGMGPFSMTGQPNAMGGREVGGLANMLACHMNIENPDHRDIVKRYWDAPSLADKAGLKAVDMFKAVGEGKIKALWIMATNPVASMPNSNAVEKAIKNCPFVVVSDLLEQTDTVRHAHIALPSTGWGEKSGTVTNSERRISRQRGFLKTAGEAKADWWQMAEVAKRMGFKEAFTWDNAAAVYREYATMSAFENNDTRDFNIGAHSILSDQGYEALSPFQWPMEMGEKPKETRFFANGNFYTPNRKANFITVSKPEGAKYDETHPLTLNTGRIRDQWHTMTRTGKTGRLTAHLAEPFIEIHPEDAQSMKVESAGLLEVTTPRGSIIARALITERQQKGSLFAPLHWTDQFSSRGRVDTLHDNKVDPYSGQPAFKSLAVSSARYPAQWYAFAVSTNKPKPTAIDYWATVKCDGGWRTELAHTTTPDDIASLLGIDAEAEPIIYTDNAKRKTRYAWFKSDKLIAVIYCAQEPVSLSRTWASSLLTKEFKNKEERFTIIAGQPGADMPDKGAIICSCFGVGANEIKGAISAGCQSVGAIGAALNAGTNCGSCKSEIQGIINEAMPLITAEAAE